MDGQGAFPPPDDKTVVFDQVPKKGKGPPRQDQIGEKGGRRRDAKGHQPGNLGKGAVDPVGKFLPQQLARLGDQGGKEENPRKGVGGGQGEGYNGHSPGLILFDALGPLPFGQGENPVCLPLGQEEGEVRPFVTSSWGVRPEEYRPEWTQIKRLHR